MADTIKSTNDKVLPSPLSPNMSSLNNNHNLTSRSKTRMMQAKQI